MILVCEVLFSHFYCYNFSFFPFLFLLGLENGTLHIAAPFYSYNLKEYLNICAHLAHWYWHNKGTKLFPGAG